MIVWAAIGLLVLYVMVLADAVTDKRHDAKIYPGYHKRFKKFRPVWLWRRFQNRWHIWKQARFLLPGAYIGITSLYIVGVHLGVAIAIGLGLLVVSFSAWLWDMVEPPIWWD